MIALLFLVEILWEELCITSHTNQITSKFDLVREQKDLSITYRLRTCTEA
jgi:hypothetical protein